MSSTGTICSTTVMVLKKKITLREGESFRRIALKQLPVGTHLIRFRVDLDVGVASFSFMSLLRSFRHPRTAVTARRRPARLPPARPAAETKCTDNEFVARP